MASVKKAKAKSQNRRYFQQFKNPTLDTFSTSQEEDVSRKGRTHGHPTNSPTDSEC